MKIPHRLVSLLIFVLWMSLPGQACARHAIIDDWLTLATAVPRVNQFMNEPCPVPAPIVTVKVGVPACVDANRNLEYRILVENASPAQALKVVVLDQLPANAKFVRSSPLPHRTGPELQWHLGTLKGNSCQEITLVLAPTNDEDVTNCVRVQFEHGVCVTTRQVRLPSQTPGEKVKPKEPSTEEPPLATGGRLTIDVKGPKKHDMNRPARYVITVKNVGSGPAQGVSIETVLDDRLTFVEASKPGVFVPDKRDVNKVGWSLGILPANESRSVELVLRARESGLICLKTRAEFDPKEVFTLFEQFCTTFVGGVPAMYLEMFDSRDPIPVNGTTSYPIVILNPGTAPVTNVRIKAMIPAGMKFLRASGPVGFREEGEAIIFEPLATLQPGVRENYEVHTEARMAGDMIFTVQMTADQLSKAGPVIEQERTTVYSEAVPLK